MIIKLFRVIVEKVKAFVTIFMGNILFGAILYIGIDIDDIYKNYVIGIIDF